MSFRFSGSAARRVQDLAVLGGKLSSKALELSY
jgi:hypothetical protein